MKKQKKPPLKSKPAAKRAVTLDDLQAELKAINQKLDYLVVRSAPMNREEWPPLIEEAERRFEEKQ